MYYKRYIFENLNVSVFNLNDNNTNIRFIVNFLLKLNEK